MLPWYTQPAAAIRLSTYATEATPVTSAASAPGRSKISPSSSMVGSPVSPDSVTPMMIMAKNT